MIDSMCESKLNGEKGSISILVLILGVAFSMLAGGLVMFGSLEYTGVRRNESSLRALSIAEAGINYYRWHLAHDPDDYYDGNGSGDPGPYEHVYTDPVTGVSGTYSLEITPPGSGSNIIIVKSTGWSDELPGLTRTVTARFGPVPLTKFSFIHNANIWFGNGMVIEGEVLNNGGIRNDATNTARVASSKSTYTCGLESGCVQPEEKPGVWGNGGPQDLWEYPISAYDFDNIVVDFAAMKQSAQDEGLYLGTTSNYGYHLVFTSDGFVSVYQVTSAGIVEGWTVEEGCVNTYQEINAETLVGTYPLDDNQIIYAEDNVWVEGVINGSTTVVAARLPIESYNTDIWIYDNLTYLDKDGSNNLGLIAQRDVIFALKIPQNFEINAAMLAQTGRVIRHHYNMNDCSHSNYSNRNQLEIYGTIISNKKSYWNFSNPQGPTSGFTKRDVIYNQDASFEPPPYFPYTGMVELLSWDED